MTKKKNSYTDVFKQNAVELSKELGIIKAAQELGVSEMSIRNWQKKILSSTSSSKKTETDIRHTWPPSPFRRRRLKITSSLTFYIIRITIPVILFMGSHIVCSADPLICLFTEERRRSGFSAGWSSWDGRYRFVW